MSSIILAPGMREGSVKIPASKSQAHRLLICAALGKEDTEIICDGVSLDIAATAKCLAALGAGIELDEAAGRFFVKPIKAADVFRGSDGICELNCGESGSTLRFLLPLVGALGKKAVFNMEGRLPERPLAPFDDELRMHGMEIRREGSLLYCSGKLKAGKYTLPGNVSSQYISGLLMALPLLSDGSELTVTGAFESEGYVHMTEEALKLAGVNFEKDGQNYVIPGGQRAKLPRITEVEGDYSNAAFFLCAGALSKRGVRVLGLAKNSVQGDRMVLDILKRFGAEIREENDAVTVRKGSLKGIEIDAGPIPDLIPVLSTVAAVSEGETRIVNAGRLRLKESDRLKSTRQMLTALGADITELDEGLLIKGKELLCGGIAFPENDHRIAMAAAVGACISENPVTVRDCECTAKSYPRFWDDFKSLALTSK